MSADERQPEPGRDHATALLDDLRSEDEARQTRVFDRVYNELREIARRYMGRERANHTLQPTELVNEACLKLLPSHGLDDLTERRFLGFGARAMRQVLTDHARRAAAQKRGGHWPKVTLQNLAENASENHVELLSLDAAMTNLAEADPRLSEMTELHYFGGLTGDQLAHHFEVSRSTVNRELSLARALLLREIDRIESDRP